LPKSIKHNIPIPNYPRLSKRLPKEALQQLLENPCERSLAEEAKLPKVNSSPARHSFQKYSDELDEVLERVRNQDQERIADPEWQKDNLEYDLRSNKWICDKTKSTKTYAQNLYAALCNRDWQRNEVWPLLKDQRWSCSWRHAGGIVADMREEGNYMDWYCSGIQSEPNENWVDLGHVSEGTVTDQIREDLFKLGWIPKEPNND
jgi:hypothetical protein